ncbi:unnamed protein product [Chironomus riparius]|uniref:Uncharacterized protein n=1 Tax=Chironomus riparius TaxID=315576 RepID=A0A9N9WT78_9DIPT|nr:unnamed protein product [Chironomus riparius]
MRFTKKDIVKLLEYGRAFYNPSLTAKSRLNFVKIIKTEAFPNATIEELIEKFDFLYKKYQAFKSGSEKKFEYYAMVDMAVNLANKNHIPKAADIEILSDDDDEYIPEEVTGIEQPKISTNKRSNDEDIQTGAKKIKLDVNYVPFQENNIPIVPIQTNEIQCVKIDESVLQDIELNVTNAVLESLKKEDEVKAQSLNESFQLMKNELRSLIQNGTTEIVQIMHKKEKEHRLSDVYVMIKTLLDEQMEANETLKEIKTILKSTIGAQKVQHDVDIKQYDAVKNNEVLLKKVLSIIQENNTLK